MTAVRRIRPVLRLKRLCSPDVLAKAWAVYQGLESDPQRFPAPTPPLVELKGQIGLLEQTEHAAQSRAKGTVAARNVARSVLVGMLESERAYVQTLCDKVSPDEATAFVHAAGMFVATPPQYNKPLLAAKPGPAAGSVTLDANVGELHGNRGRRCLFHWQWTADGGTSFHDAAPTLLGTTIITGLTPLTTVGFRVSASHVEGQGDWSPIVSILVL